MPSSKKLKIVKAMLSTLVKIKYDVDEERVVSIHQPNEKNKIDAKLPSDVDLKGLRTAVGFRL